MSRFSQQKFRKKSRSSQKSARRDTALAKNAAPLEVTISHIGGRGDGVGQADYTHNYQTKTHMVFVPDTLPGERVIIQPTHLSGQGITGQMTELLDASDDRKSPDCGASPACGGCQFQHMKPHAYQSWKETQLKTILEKSGISPAKWEASFFSPLAARRRARLALRRRQDDVIIGFRERASHHIIPPTDCTILAPEIITVISQLQQDLLLALTPGMTGEVEITLCDNGSDVTLLSDQSWDSGIITDLTSRATLSQDIIRLSLLDRTDKKSALPLLLITRHNPVISWSLPEGCITNAVKLYPAPLTFLQADRAAESEMRHHIFASLQGYDKVLDLFAGSGTLSSSLLYQPTPPTKLAAYDNAKTALASFEALAHAGGFSMNFSAQYRNLFDAPLTDKELDGFEACIIDPPRAGAAAQMPALANSQLKRIIMVSCNPHSFARDAAILCEAGWHCKWARHIDQFVMTSHSEIIACFDNPHAIDA